MSADMAWFLELAPLGFLIGAYGTLVGAGGGSVLVPALLFLLPGESSATITAISLAVVFFNAYSGTVAYARMGRIDVRAGAVLTLASVPGSRRRRAAPAKTPQGRPASARSENAGVTPMTYKSRSDVASSST